MEIGRKPISIVVPVHNEEENLLEMYSRLCSTLEKTGKDYEIVFVDDGSTDQSYRILHEISEDRNVRIIRLRSRFGQSAALDAGFTRANGDIIITIDSDLQDDPENIPEVLQALEKFDVVCGFRLRRQDPFEKRVASKIYNWLARLILRVRVHDLNCGLRGFRKEVLQDLDVLGEMHRYLPAIAAWSGFKVGEVKIEHSPRKHGKSKYGFTRLFKGLIDMLTVKFLVSYSARPAHIFGLFGTVLLAIGSVTGLYLTILKIVYDEAIGERPLLLLAVLLLVLGFQMLSFGMMAEMTSRVLYTVGKNKPYIIDEILEH